VKSIDKNIAESIPIGRCLPGRKVFILDNYGQQIIPDGRNTGEIFLGGIGIFGGYLNKPEESARVLVRLPNIDGIFYRTGDIGKINCDGELVFVGRTDFQVKLRGQRIELGEIETVIMRSSSQITNCVVIKLNHNNEEHLVAYLQTTAHLDNTMLRDDCIKHLPLYMVPSLFVLLHRFPLNPNGKLDRKALPSPDFSLLLSSNLTVGNEQPQTEMEQQVSSIWSQILHLKAIPPITTNFFQLGGNSLLLMKLHHKYQTQFHQSINISNLFRHATIIDHVQLLEEHQETIQTQWQSFHLNKGKLSLYKKLSSFDSLL
jgi:aryl carrier-like protein